MSSNVSRVIISLLAVELKRIAGKNNFPIHGAVLSKKTRNSLRDNTVYLPRRFRNRLSQPAGTVPMSTLLLGVSKKTVAFLNRSKDSAKRNASNSPKNRRRKTCILCRFLKFAGVPSRNIFVSEQLTSF